MSEPPRNGAFRPPPGDPAPPCVDTLMARADRLVGLRLGDLARQLGVSVPVHSRHAKGWAGQLVEIALGASAGSTPQPDFPELGIELKTLPIDPRGRPRESTHVCVAPLVIEPGAEWGGSLVRRKLARVLWFPILSEPMNRPAERLICTPFLWSPDAEEEKALRQDWEEHIERIALGQADRITARDGLYLQLRPKAASGRETTWTTDRSGQRVAANPRGFYLRARFTARVLERHFPDDAKR